MDMANAVLQYTALSQAKQAINQKLLLFIDSEIAILKKAYKKILRQPIFDKDIPTSKKRVLLVEDSLFIQHIHHTMLKSMGCHVDIANQGVEAIQLSQNKYDIIILVGPSRRRGEASCIRSQSRSTCGSRGHW